MPDMKQDCIGSDSGMAPNRLPAIIQSKADRIYWRIYASISLDEKTLVLPFLFWETDFSLLFLRESKIGGILCRYFIVLFMFYIS